MFRAIQRKMVGFGMLLSFSVSLTGCGGSVGSSSSSSAPTASSPATIFAATPGSSEPGYQIVLLPSGAATYTTELHGQSLQTGNGAVSASLTSKFFEDIAAASPLSNFPAGVVVSSLTPILKVGYQGQQADLYGPGYTRAQTLITDCTAIAQVLGLVKKAL